MNNIYKRIEHQNNIFTYRIDDPWIEIHLFSSMVVKKFYRHISKFKNLLPEDNTNLYIKRTYNALWNLYILYCHTPISSLSLLNVAGITLEEMKKDIEIISESNQALGRVSKKIIKMIAALNYRDFQNKTISKELLEKIRNKKTFIILNTRCGRYVELISTISEQFDIPKTQILTESEFLRSYIMAEELLLFGPVRSYSHDILTSLMFKKVHYLVNDKFKELDFKNICFTNSFTREIKANYKFIKNEDVSDDNFDEEDLFEAPINEHSHIEFDQILNNSEFSRPSHHTDQIVKARLAFLTSNMFVFLANDKTVDETQRAVVFDRDSSEPDIIEKKVSHFNVGDYVILRTEGGGDLIIPYANEIMGQKAGHYRTLQKQWKYQLDLKIRNIGYQRAIRDLKSDIPIISQGNLDRWIHNEKQIALKDSGHFKVLLKYIGYQTEEIKEIIESIKAIRSAHQVAGNVQSRELLEDIKKDNEIENTLREKGIYKIQLKARGMIGGAMTVFRIIDFDSREHRMPYSRCDTPHYRS